MDKRLSSLGVTAVLGTSAITMALAAGAAPAVAQPPDVQTVQAPAQRSFNIGPQSLASALPLFGQQSGRQNDEGEPDKGGQRQFRGYRHERARRLPLV